MKHKCWWDYIQTTFIIYLFISCIQHCIYLTPLYPFDNNTLAGKTLANVCITNVISTKSFDPEVNTYYTVDNSHILLWEIFFFVFDLWLCC